MNLLEKIGIFRTNIKERKILSILEKIIDSIEENNDTVSIKLNKNIFIETTGSMMTISNGYKIDIAREIHLNPEIQICLTDTFEEVDSRLVLMKKNNAERYKQLKSK